MPFPLHAPVLAFVLLLVVQLQHPQVYAHTWLTSPRAFNRVYKARDCKGRQCRDACPQRWAHGMNNSASDPAATWRRGQTVRITYARNNHHGGMLRLALVPVDRMWDKKWHERLTLMHGCWESDRHKCRRGEDCGTDKDGDAFARVVRIPTVFPDGDYVLGFVWYGGLFYDSKRGFFPDYYSCSHVRISGGKPLGGSFQSYFEAGRGDKIRRGKCKTSADVIGQCERKGCPRKKSFRGFPRLFSKGKQTPVIKPQDVAKGFRPQGVLEGRFAGAPYPPTPSNGNQTYHGDEQYGRRIKDRGICVGPVCCASSCGQCGGDGCETSGPGGHSCCMGKILESGRRCSRTVFAPCIQA